MRKFFIIQRPARKSLPSFSLQKLAHLLLQKFPEIVNHTEANHKLSVRTILNGNGFSIGLTTERHDIMPLAVHLHDILFHECDIIIVYKSPALKLVENEFRENYTMIETAEIISVDMEDDYVDAISAEYLCDLVTRLLRGEGFSETEE